MGKADEIIERATPEQLQVFNKLMQFSAQGCNGNVTIHFAAGIPKKFDASTTEPISNKK